MKTKTTGNVPAELERSRRRFEQWRQRRRAGSRIPESLWAEAVKLAGKHGVSRTARVLRVGYYSLLERLESETAGLPASAPAGSGPLFLELAAPAQTGTGECLVEWEDATGAKMRVHLKGVAAPDLVALSRSFWGVEP